MSCLTLDLFDGPPCHHDGIFYTYYIISTYKNDVLYKICDKCKNLLNNKNENIFHKFIFGHFSFEKISKEKYEYLFTKYNANLIDNKILSNNVIDFCNKWGVSIEFQDEGQFQNTFKNSFKDLAAIHNVETLRNSNELNFFENPFFHCGIDLSKKKIIIKNLEHTKLNKTSDKKISFINYIVLHELTHILMKVIPYELFEFSSPFYALNLMFLWHLKTGENLTGNLEKLRNIYKIQYGLKEVGNSMRMKFNSFNEYMEFHVNTLIKLGLLNDKHEFTFNSDDVVPDKTWYYIPEMYEFRQNNSLDLTYMKRHDDSFKIERLTFDE